MTTFTTELINRIEHSPIWDAQQKEFLGYAKAGLNYTEIADKMGLSSSRIGQVANRILRMTTSKLHRPTPASTGDNLCKSTPIDYDRLGATNKRACQYIRKQILTPRTWEEAACLLAFWRVHEKSYLPTKAWEEVRDLVKDHTKDTLEWHDIQWSISNITKQRR
jgi:hypothetical protein